MYYYKVRVFSLAFIRKSDKIKKRESESFRPIVPERFPVNVVDATHFKTAMSWNVCRSINHFMYPNLTNTVLMSTTPPLKVLYEDNHLLVLNKPAGIATMGLPEGEPTLLAQAKDYVARKYDKKGNVYLGVVSRLDFFVSGIIVFARTSKAAARLNDQFRSHTVQKIYHALVEGRIFPTEDTCSDWICEDPHHRKMWITQAPGEQNGAKNAVLHYKKIEWSGTHSLLEVELQTGRKHQIRLQLSHRGYPILGDFKYGSRTTFPNGIALNASRLRFRHPVQDVEIDLEAPLPEYWNTDKYLKK